MRRIASLALGAVISCFGTMAAAQTPELAPGPVLDLIKDNCTSCHDFGTITRQGRTAEQWSQIINRMMAHGATISDAQADQIQNYLTQNLPPAAPHE